MKNNECRDSVMAILDNKYFKLHSCRIEQNADMGESIERIYKPTEYIGT